MSDREEIKLSQIKVLKVDCDEAETSISMMRRDDMMQIYTSDNTMITKLKKIAGKGKEWKIYIAGTINNEPTGYIFECPKSLLTLRAAKKEITKEYTPEERAEIGKRFRKNKNKTEE